MNEVERGAGGRFEQRRLRKQRGDGDEPFVLPP